MSKKIIKRIYNVVIILLFLGAIGWCFSHFYHGSDVAYTDDAQVNRHITPINTRVPGFIKEIRFNDYQHVKKGDTLVLVIRTSAYPMPSEFFKIISCLSLARVCDIELLALLHLI